MSPCRPLLWPLLLGLLLFPVTLAVSLQRRGSKPRVSADVPAMSFLEQVAHWTSTAGAEPIQYLQHQHPPPLSPLRLSRACTSTSNQFTRRNFSPDRTPLGPREEVWLDSRGHICNPPRSPLEMLDEDGNPVRRSPFFPAYRPSPGCSDRVVRRKSRTRSASAARKQASLCSWLAWWS